MTSVRVTASGAISGCGNDETGGAAGCIGSGPFEGLMSAGCGLAVLDAEGGGGSDSAPVWLLANRPCPKNGLFTRPGILTSSLSRPTGVIVFVANWLPA